MVLKRLLVTTLGALGLGALAAGPASAQQVPAPDLFDGQVACSSNVPSGMAMADAALGMSLGDTIKAGGMIAITKPDPDDPNQVIYVAGAAGETYTDLTDLSFIIPPGNSNCGAGAYTQAEVDAANANGGVAGFEAGDPKMPVSGAIAKDVAAGYTDTLNAYLAVSGADGADDAVKMARDLLKDDPEDEDLQGDLTDALTAQTAAHSDLYSVGAGPINMLGIAEWRAKFAVEDAVDAWNEAVETAEMASSTDADGDLDLAYNDKYVPVNSSQLLALFDDDVDILDADTITAKVRVYANAEGGNESAPDTNGVFEPTMSVTESAFDDAGNLIAPMRDDGDTSDTTVTLEADTNATATYSIVNIRLVAVNEAVDALVDLQEKNQNALLQPAIDEAVRRAKLEQAHYQAQFDAMVADTTNLDDTDDIVDTDVDEAAAAAYSIKSRYDAYLKAKTDRDNAGVELQTAFQEREAATAAVAAAFTDPQAFYQQLVDRREFLKARKRRPDWRALQATTRRPRQ